MSLSEPKAAGRKIARAIRDEYGLDGVRHELKAALDRIERDAEQPPLLVPDDRDEKIARLNRLVDEQQAVHARALAEVERLEALVERLTEQRDEFEARLDEIKAA